MSGAPKASILNSQKILTKKLAYLILYSRKFPPNRLRDPVAFRFFFDLTVDGLSTLFLLEFEYDREWDRYEMNVYCGGEPVGYCHGYGNKGWNPQVNNIWVVESLRRRGVATIMLSKVEDYFRHLPFPGTKIADNEAARAFWKSYLSGPKSVGGRRRRARSA